MSKGEVSFYTKGIAEIVVNFPENDIACKYCPFYSFTTKHCGIDRNIVPPYPDRSVDRLCPLEIIEEVE